MSARAAVLRTAGLLVAAFAVVLGLMIGLGEVLVHLLVPGPLGRADDRIETALATHRTPLWNTLTDAGTQLAQPLTIEVALAVAVALLAVATRRVLPPLFLAVTVVGESTIYFLTSTLVPRDRPHVPRLGVGDPVASYPSGHAAASLCFYGGLAVLAVVLTRSRPLRGTLVALAVLLPPLVGFCRMYRGFHHLTDILSGLLLGALWLTLTTRLLFRPDRAPVAVPSHAPQRAAR